MQLQSLQRVANRVDVRLRGHVLPNRRQHQVHVGREPRPLQGGDLSQALQRGGQRVRGPGRRRDLGRHEGRAQANHNAAERIDGDRRVGVQLRQVGKGQARDGRVRMLGLPQALRTQHQERVPPRAHLLDAHIPGDAVGACAMVDVDGKAPLAYSSANLDGAAAPALDMVGNESDALCGA
eukprot:CAMPEP_0204122298 /NCGR_PEP_ID=MMETSP0361-20130328/8654_2 /ASSEMBLY_ACC=CAM_ASM_000343 /TAXON_ID=268821 /ORGANISM="Scrippsiella Hangoei, Strain SHTV-5" /LENGTH=179 /DNA_ID=CAMNT_0051073637 /DNA_START=184 /DNA_END=724 /DNA_ORIENTATION=-